MLTLRHPRRNRLLSCALCEPSPATPTMSWDAAWHAAAAGVCCTPGLAARNSSQASTERALLKTCLLTIIICKRHTRLPWLNSSCLKCSFLPVTKVSVSAWRSLRRRLMAAMLTSTVSSSGSSQTGFRLPDGPASLPDARLSASSMPPSSAASSTSASATGPSSSSFSSLLSPATQHDAVSNQLIAGGLVTLHRRPGASLTSAGFCLHDWLMFRRRRAGLQGTVRGLCLAVGAACWPLGRVMVNV